MTYAIPEPNLARLDTMIREGRVLRNKWHDTDAEGRELACLLAAVAGPIKDAAECPAQFMPQWLAYLTPKLDDQVSAKAWSAVIARYQAVMHRIHLLTPEGSERAKFKTLDAALIEVDPFAKVGVVQRVRALIARHLAGDRPSRDEWTAAGKAARAAEEAARESANVAAAAAANAAVEEAAVWVAVDMAVDEAAANAAAGLASMPADAPRAVWDRIADACLTALEQEVMA